MSETEPLHVLVVADEVDAAEALRFTIEDGGYKVVTATDIEDGMAKALEQKFQAAVVVMSMNGRSGLDDPRNLKDGSFADMPSVILADAQEADVRKRFTGYDGFVRRDAELSELMNHLARLTASLSDPVSSTLQADPPGAAWANSRQ